MSINFGNPNESRFYILPHFELPSENWTSIAICRPENDFWYLIFMRDDSGERSSGLIELVNGGIYSNPVVINYGLENGNTLWTGYLSWYAVLRSSLSDSELVALSSGEVSILPSYEDKIIDLWDFHKADELIPSMISGLPAVRFGEGYDEYGADPLPIFKNLPGKRLVSNTVIKLHGGRLQ